MIFEMRTYELKVGVMQQYLKQFGDVGLPIVSRYCRLVGYWIVESGRLNRVIHVWAFDSLEHRRSAREQWWQDREWIEAHRWDQRSMRRLSSPPHRTGRPIRGP
jgi:hypothetical protein